MIRGGLERARERNLQAGHHVGEYRKMVRGRITMRAEEHLLSAVECYQEAVKALLDHIIKSEGRR